DTGSYYLKTFCDVDYEMMNSSIILSNERILSSYLDRYGAGYEAYYGGTGNTLTVVISVVVRNDDGSEEVRKFKVDIVG
ncbi:MAG: hypothetical protein MR270_02805, partial [Erysipelotrichaceae bacterium]|nr:hypothetical protein [Erysipelotrichaceae bacterium]